MTDRFYARWIIGGIVVLLIVAGACYFWYQHDIAPYKQEAAEAEKLLRQSKKLKQVSKTGNTAQQATDVTPAESETPPAEKPTAKKTQDNVTVSTETSIPKMSPFGLGELPKPPPEWNAHYYWDDIEDVETELLLRFMIKIWHEGKEYGSVGINHETGLIEPIERGTVLVEYYTDAHGNKKIWSVEAHPDDLALGIYKDASEIPSHLKVVTPDEISIDPYEYLGIEK